MHEANKAYACEDCGKKFALKGNMEKHQASHRIKQK